MRQKGYIQVILFFVLAIFLINPVDPIITTAQSRSGSSSDKVY